MENEVFKIVLASKSPRRRELLKKLLNDFEVTSVDIEETIEGTKESEIVENLARRKAEAIDLNALIITSDTLVFDDGYPLGKPKDKEDAFQILKRLNNKVHSVSSGVCLKSPFKTVAFSVSSKVYFRNMTDEEIRFYIDKFNPLDKAGAYGVQDGFCVEKTEGSYSNVMGLPLEKLSEQLKNFGVNVKELT